MEILGARCLVDTELVLEDLVPHVPQAGLGDGLLGEHARGITKPLALVGDDLVAELKRPDLALRASSGLDRLIGGLEDPELSPGRDAGRSWKEIASFLPPILSVSATVV